MNRLPKFADTNDFQRWRASPDNWMQAVTIVACSAGIDPENPVPFQTGTNLVVDLNGTAILKLFPPIYAEQFLRERASLRQLDGRLSVPIPALIDEGQEDGWSWLILSKLEGTVGSDVWPLLSEAERVQILWQIGQTIAQVQAVTPGALAKLQPSWEVFVEGQRDGCIARHQSHGLPERFVKDLRAIVDQAPFVLPHDRAPVILTGEWIPENLLLSQTSDGWRLGAVFDFGDVTTGLGEYDLLGPSTFMCAGVPNRLRAFLEGYGMTSRAYDATMRRQLLTLMVLHRASDLRGINIANWAQKIDRLHDLEGLIWPDVF